MTEQVHQNIKVADADEIDLRELFWFSNTFILPSIPWMMFSLRDFNLLSILTIVGKVSLEPLIKLLRSVSWSLYLKICDCNIGLILIMFEGI